jgi:hypothetical protein
LELLISNSGNGPLELYSITSTDPVFTTNFAPDTLSPGDTISLTVTFTPTAVIVYTDTLTIISNDDPASVILSGEGILPVNIVLTPYGAPIVIPVGGGSFDFNILIENFTGSAQTTDMWTLIFAPNNAVVGPTLLINGLTLPPNFSGDRDRNQVVPAFAPAGTYTYRGYIGDYPWVVDDLSFFTFEKLGGAGDYLGSANDWICSGEPFDGEFISSALPEKYALHPAHPNPFNAVTTLCYDLPEAEIVSLVIYDVLGREVVRLCDSYQVAGEYNVSFDGSGLASGIYFAQLQAGGFNQVKKIVLMK